MKGKRGKWREGNKWSNIFFFPRFRSFFTTRRAKPSGEKNGTPMKGSKKYRHRESKYWIKIHFKELSFLGWKLIRNSRSFSIELVCNVTKSHKNFILMSVILSSHEPYLQRVLSPGHIFIVKTTTFFTVAILYTTFFVSS